MAKKFFNIVSGAHEGVRSVVFSQRVLSEPIPGLEPGMLLAPDAGGKYRLADAGDEHMAEFVFETDERQSSGTVTTVWGVGEFETNTFDSVTAGDYVTVVAGVLTGGVATGYDPETTKWYCLTDGKSVRLKAI